MGADRLRMADMDEKPIGFTFDASSSTITVEVECEHVWGDWEEVTPAKCETAGLKKHVCTKCPAEETQEISKLGHDLKEEVVQPYPCKAGTKITTCKREGCDYHEEDVVEPTADHILHEEVQEKATCETSGTKIITCERGCGFESTEEIPALDHLWDEGVETKEAGCETKGEKTFTCKHNCGKSYTEEIPALGHSWGEWEEVTPAGCETKGLEKRTCTRCPAEDTRETAALGHEYDEGVVTTDPGCETKGKKTFTCKHNCGESYTEEIPALGHDWSEWTKDEEASTDSKLVEERICSRCTKTETREVDITEVKQEISDLPTAKDISEETKKPEERIELFGQLAELEQKLSENVREVLSEEEVTKFDELIEEVKEQNHHAPIGEKGDFAALDSDDWKCILVTDTVDMDVSKAIVKSVDGEVLSEIDVCVERYDEEGKRLVPVKGEKFTLTFHVNGLKNIKEKIVVYHFSDDGTIKETFEEGKNLIRKDDEISVEVSSFSPFVIAKAQTTQPTPVDPKKDNGPGTGIAGESTMIGVVALLGVALCVGGVLILKKRSAR